MSPIGPNRRRLLNQSLHTSVLNSTASSDRHGRVDGGVADGLAEPGRGDGHDRANEWARGVILAAVLARVAHVFDLRLVELRKLILLRLRLKAEFVHMVDDITQGVAALDAISYLAEDCADFVFDGVRAGGLGLGLGLGLETIAIRKELGVDEGDEVVVDLGGVAIDLAVLAFGRSPRSPAIGFVEDVGVFPAAEGGVGGLVVFESVEVFQEEQSGGLLGVIEFASAAGVFPEDVVDVFEGLFEHGLLAVRTVPQSLRAECGID